MADKKKSVKKPSAGISKSEKSTAPNTNKPAGGFTPREEMSIPSPAVFDASSVKVEGVKNGHNRKFTTDVSLFHSSEFGLFLNDVRQTRPNDYSVVTPDGMTFMFSTAPSLTARIEVRKLK
jgi:hypothetical protein